MTATIDMTAFRRTIQQFQDEFSAAGIGARFGRAAGWTADVTVKRAALAIRDEIDAVFDRPTPWIARGFAYKRTITRGLKSDAQVEIASDMFVLGQQSAWVKFHMGQAENVRLPGDVGPSRRQILIPVAKNLKRAQGIDLNRYGNLGTSVIDRLEREVRGEKANRSRNRDRWSVYKTTVTEGGSPSLRYIARPPREAVSGESTAFTRADGTVVVVPKVRNTDKPRVLLYSVPKARYKPVLQPLWDKSVDTALNEAEGVMRAELERERAFAIAKGRIKP